MASRPRAVTDLATIRDQVEETRADLEDSCTPTGPDESPMMQGASQAKTWQAPS
jgi:hypothetical protein